MIQNKKNIVRYTPEMLASFICNSNKIESINYSYEETVRIIEEWHKIKDPVSRKMFEQTTPCEIMQHYKAVRWALRNCGIMSWSEVLKMHRILMKGQLGPQEAGILRRVQVYIGNHMPPAPGEPLLAAMQSLFKWIEENLPHSKSEVRRLSTMYEARTIGARSDDWLSNKIYEAHIRYECVHPFVDGNGRSGRILWLTLLHHFGLEFNEVDIDDRWLYYRSLASFQGSCDITQVKWMPPRSYC